MNTERDAFIRRIAEEPDDDTVRLVFADWLEEHGDEARARFIRLQVEVARLSSGSGHAAELVARIALLFRPAWLLDDLPALAERAARTTSGAGTAAIVRLPLEVGREVPVRVRWHRGFAVTVEHELRLSAVALAELCRLVPSHVALVPVSAATTRPWLQL